MTRRRLPPSFSYCPSFYSIGSVKNEGAGIDTSTLVQSIVLKRVRFIFRISAGGWLAFGGGGNVFLQ